MLKPLADNLASSLATSAACRENIGVAANFDIREQIKAPSSQHLSAACVPCSGEGKKQSYKHATTIPAVCTRVPLCRRRVLKKRGAFMYLNPKQAARPASCTQAPHARQAPIL